MYDSGVAMPLQITHPTLSVPPNVRVVGQTAQTQRGPHRAGDRSAVVGGKLPYQKSCMAVEVGTVLVPKANPY